MHYISLPTSLMRNQDFLSSSAEEIAIWLQLLAYCAEEESGGIIPHADTLTDRVWYRMCGQPADIIRQCTHLLAWSDDGTTLTVLHYPLAQQAQLQAQRDGGRRGAQARQLPPSRKGGKNKASRIPDRLPTRLPARLPNRVSNGDAQGTLKTDNPDNAGNDAQDADITALTDTNNSADSDAMSATSAISQITDDTALKDTSRLPARLPTRLPNSIPARLPATYSNVMYSNVYITKQGGGDNTTVDRESALSTPPPPDAEADIDLTALPDRPAPRPPRHDDEPADDIAPNVLKAGADALMSLRNEWQGILLSAGERSRLADVLRSMPNRTIPPSLVDDMRRYFADAPADANKWDYPADRLHLLNHFGEVAQKASVWASHHPVKRKRASTPAVVPKDLTPEQRQTALAQMADIKRVLHQPTPIQSPDA